MHFGAALQCAFKIDYQQTAFTAIHCTAAAAVTAVQNGIELGWMLP